MPSPTGPEVSVVIPTLNRWELLERAVRCAADQAEVSVELVVVNDGSDEPAPAALRARPAVRVIDHGKRLGVATARNTGIAESRAPWIAFLDDDDLWAPTRLAALLEVVRAERSDFAYSSAVVVDAMLLPLYLQRAPQPQTLLRDLIRGNAIPGGGSSVVARADLLRDLGGFDPALSFVEDWDLWIRLAEAAKASAFAEPLTAYCQHAESRVLWGDPPIRGDLGRIERKHAAISRRLGVVPDHRGFDRSMAHNVWLSGRRGQAVQAYLAAARHNRDAVALVHGARACFPPRWSRWLRRTPAPDPTWLVERRKAEARATPASAPGRSN